jgi:hypothetical protein
MGQIELLVAAEFSRDDRRQAQHQAYQQRQSALEQPADQALHADKKPTLRLALLSANMLSAESD